MRAAVTGVTVLLACLVVCGHASGHTLSRSRSEWRLHGSEATVSLVVPVVEVARVHPRARGLDAAGMARDPVLSAWVRQRAGDLHLGADPDGCRVIGDPRLGTLGRTHLRLQWRIRCERPPSPRVRVELFFTSAKAHLHVVRWAGPHGKAEVVLDAEHREWDFGDHSNPATAGPGLLTTIRTGVLHVLEGADHIAFVVALMLLGGSFWAVVGIATGFTIGHTLTLGLAMAGVVSPSTMGVEVIVGVSVAFCALECFRARHELLGPACVLGALHIGLLVAGLPPGLVLGSALTTGCLLALPAETVAVSRRVAIASVFGLVHGLAFAGTLVELLGGAASPIVGLLGFNVGVELGQISVIAVTVGSLALARRVGGDRVEGWLVDGGAAVILALGLAWSITRVA